MFDYFGELTKIASLEKKLYCSFLQLNNKIIAGNIGFIEFDTMNIVRTAYLDAFSEYSPSNYLFIETVNHFSRSDTPIKRINYFTKSYGYKHRFSHDNETCNTYIIPNTDILSKVYLLFYKMRMGLRQDGDALKSIQAKELA